MCKVKMNVLHTVSHPSNSEHMIQCSILDNSVEFMSELHGRFNYRCEHWFMILTGSTSEGIGTDYTHHASRQVRGIATDNSKIYK